MPIENDKPDCCDCCYYDTEELELSSETVTPIPRKWLCSLCSASLAGNVAIYQKVYDGDLLMIVGVVMNAANHVIAEIRRARAGDTQGRGENRK